MSRSQFSCTAVAIIIQLVDIHILPQLSKYFILNYENRNMLTCYTVITVRQVFIHNVNNGKEILNTVTL